MINKNLAELIYYAKAHLYLQEEDEVYLTNILLSLFQLDEPYEGEIDKAAIESLEVPDSLLQPLREHLSSLGFSSEEVEKKLVFALGLLTPLPSTVTDTFNALREVDPKEATDYLYSLSIANNYVALTQIRKNLLWRANFKDGPDLDISINLSKPEKNNKDIAALLSKKSSSYPKCRLCYQNLGYEGKGNFPPRGNIRLIPLQLDDDLWYLQYSPYGYFNEHCILLYEHHVPMAINRSIVSKLFAFNEKFPHYFIGSNADLPIVGGSILDHEHFQGGNATLPLMEAKMKKEIPLTRFPNSKAYIVDFYDTALCLKGKDKEELLDLFDAILHKWQSYEDKENNIISNDEEGLHSTITPILRQVDGIYELFLILRNNRTDKSHPGGIFHADETYAHIKHEGIGLIEAAGLFILPARLQRQGALIEEIVKNNTPKETYLKEHPDLDIFDDMVEKMKINHWSSEEYINDICRKILGNVAVFKDDEVGQAGLDKFLKEAAL